MIQWWYSSEGTPVGPCDVDGLAQAFGSGVIDARTLVWHEGMSGWLAIAQIPELRGVVLPAPSAYRASVPQPASYGANPYGDNQTPAYPRRGHTTAIALGIVGIVIVVIALSILTVTWKGYAKNQAAVAQQQSTTVQAGAGQASEVWQNPVTLLQAYVDTDWQRQTTQESYGTTYWFVLPAQNVGFMVVPADAPPGSSLRDVVPGVAVNLRAHGMVLDGAGQYTEDEAMPGWQFEGSSDRLPGAHVRIQVVQTKTRFWELMTFQPAGQNGYEEKLKTLHHAIISTII